MMFSSNYLKYIAGMENEDIIGFEWSAANDDRTRKTHLAADGSRVSKNNPFSVGGYKLKFPLDSSLGAPAKEIINCRCVLLYIFEGEELTSNTIYDAENVQSREWLNSQSAEFQEDYFGGKTKARLFRAGLIEPKDIDKTLKSILSDLYPVKLSPRDIMAVSELNEVAAKKVLEMANALWFHGKIENKEANETIRVRDGKKACKTVFGEYGRIDKNSKNYGAWLKYLDEAKENSVTAIHNHNDVSCPSLADLKHLLKHKSVKSLFVVSSEGKLYLVEKKDTVLYNNNSIEELEEKYISLKNEWRICAVRLAEEYDLSNADKSKMASSFYSELLNIFANVYNFNIKEWPW